MLPNISVSDEERTARPAGVTSTLATSCTMPAFAVPNAKAREGSEAASIPTASIGAEIRFMRRSPNRHMGGRCGRIVRHCTKRIVACRRGHEKWRRPRQLRPGTRITHYRCFLPDLAGFASYRRGGTDGATIDFSLHRAHLDATELSQIARW